MSDYLNAIAVDLRNDDVADLFVNLREDPVVLHLGGLVLHPPSQTPHCFEAAAFN